MEVSSLGKLLKLQFLCLDEISPLVAESNPARIPGLSWFSTWISAPATFPWHNVAWDLEKKNPKLQIKCDPAQLV